MTFLDPFVIRTKEDMKNAILTLGFLPFFRNSVPGFSLEEHVHPDAWYHRTDDRWDVWEWKGPVIRELGCAYGKFFEQKAVFVSPDFFPDFANFRRDGYDFDALYDDEKAAKKDKLLFDLVERNAPIRSADLKKLGNYGKNGVKGFDTVMNRLQRECYVLISDFVYAVDKHGKPYGWGTGVYSTPEVFLGAPFTSRVYEREPAESGALVRRRLKALTGADVRI